LVTN
jgi:hypothetical protein